MMTLEEQVIQLIAENKQLRAIIATQEICITKLKEEVRQLKLSKNSSNSSKPPSTDMFSPKRNQSLREKSGKTTGGQFGHKGTTLQMSDNPDDIIELNPCYCNKCGCNLENEESHFEAKRQEIDIPPVRARVKEYRRNSKNCPKCGHKQESEFPSHIKTNIQYGSTIESLITYLSAYQYVPFRRMQEFFSILFNIKISEGTIDNVLRRMSEKALPVYEKIKSTISQSPQRGSDETSVKVNGKKHWIWVWQTDMSTYLTALKSRGMNAIDSVFPEGFEKGILNTDRWAAQLKTKAGGHQLCLAHLLRELNFIEESDNIDWAKRFKILLITAMELKKQQSEYAVGNPLAVQLEQELNILLQEKIPKDLYKKSNTLQKSLLKNRDKIFVFLYNKDVPPDNNASERAIRNAKVKQKVSGQFKSLQQAFCVLRSVIDTCKKRDVDVMFALESIALSC